MSPAAVPIGGADGSIAWSATSLSGGTTRTEQVLRAPAPRVVRIGREAELRTGVAPLDHGVSRTALTVYVGTTDSRVAVIDTAAGDVRSTIDVGGKEPSLAMSATGDHLYVANGSELLTIDTATGALATRAAVGKEPTVVAVTPDARTAYVSNWAEYAVTPREWHTTVLQTGRDDRGVPVRPGSVGVPRRRRPSLLHSNSQR